MTPQLPTLCQILALMVPLISYTTGYKNTHTPFTTIVYTITTCGHPSAADEAWYRPKYVLCNGGFFPSHMHNYTSRPVCVKLITLAQLMRLGIGQNESCAMGDFFHTSRPICCLQLRELWFSDFIMQNTT